MRILHGVLALAATIAMAACNDILGNEDHALRRCVHNSECSQSPKTEVCLFQTCSALCIGDADCPNGRCLDTEIGNACVSQDQSACGESTSCPAPTVCEGGVCRAPCTPGAADACLKDQICSGDGVCVGTLTSHDPGASTSDAATSGTGGGSSGGVSGSSGGSGNGGVTTSGGATGSGGLASSGGAIGSGGLASSGGAIGSGGVTSTGGVSSSGGVSSTGGVSSSGGVSSTGGATGTGGASGCPGGPKPPSVNIDAAPYSFAASPTWDCNAAGTTTVNSTNGTITSDTCALGTLDVSNNVRQIDQTADSVMVVRLRGLTLTGKHVLKLRGTRAIVFLVSGDVVIDDGTVDASAVSTTPGAGGNRASCGNPAGINTTNGGGGAGGGGFGTKGGSGADGGGALGTSGLGGAVATPADLIPLRGGCPGGTGGGNTSPGGAGGGAFEISASGKFVLGGWGHPAVFLANGGGARAPAPASDCIGNGGDGGGSGGGILLVSPTGASLGQNAVARVHGGGGAGGNHCFGGTPGEDGHAANDVAAAGGGGEGASSPAPNGGGGAVYSYASGIGGAGAAGLVGEYHVGGGAGGGGAGRIQVITTPVTCQ